MMTFIKMKSCTIAVRQYGQLRNRQGLGQQDKRQKTTKTKQTNKQKTS